MVVTTFPLVSPLVLVLPVTMTRGRGVGEIGCSDSGSGSSGGSGGDSGGDGCEELVVSSEGVGVTSCIELLVVGTVFIFFLSSCNYCSQLFFVLTILLLTTTKQSVFGEEGNVRKMCGSYI